VGLLRTNTTLKEKDKMTDKRNLNNIVVVGGGAAGWMTALYLQKSLPKSKITVVESEEIGILGAGEGTTPHFISFLDFLNIPVSRLVKEASATIKNGIKFTNWRNDKDYYYHSFLAFNNLGFSGCNIDKKYLSTDAATVLSWAKKESINSIDFISKVSEKNKVPFIYNDSYTNVKDPILKFDCYGNFSVHFNASKLAKVLKDIAIERGVVRVEGIITDFKEDSYGEISEVKIKNKTIKSDFIFDCSGFYQCGQTIGCVSRARSGFRCRFCRCLLPWYYQY
jgi:glycine/D-amino acid oxidase-like deaminating enzyme